MDEKAFRPAVLIPPAFGLAGVNLHTWTGWGSVSHWNAFVANLEMHGKGTFFDPRLDDAPQFPIAAKAGFGHVKNDPDLISSKLPALHFYQLAIPAPPPAGSFDGDAASRGKMVFAERQCAHLAKFHRSTRSRDGICILPAKSVWIVSRLIELPTSATVHRP